MPGPPTISVVMPVWNAAATLGEAIASVLGQTEDHFELVVVDDGSDDGSSAMLDQDARQDARVRVIHVPHRGLVSALNVGLDAARGALVARMDADDVALPERLHLQRAHLAARADVGLVATRVVFDGDRARARGYARHVDWTNTLVSHDDIALARFVESPLAHPSVMFRRALVERFGPYADGDFPEDYELWLRWLDAGVRMEKLAAPLLVWRVAPTRLSRVDRRYAPDAFYRLKARYLARWLARANPWHPGIVAWGAGRATRARLRHLVDEGIRVSAFVDIDPKKIGTCIAGVPVLGPDDLPSPGRCFVVSYVGSLNAREQITARLTASGYRAGVDYVVAA